MSTVRGKLCSSKIRKDLWHTKLVQNAEVKNEATAVFVRGKVRQKKSSAHIVTAKVQLFARLATERGQLTRRETYRDSKIEIQNMNLQKLKWMLQKSIRVICKSCGKPFDWNDQWPDGIKKCPYCGKQN